MTLSEALAKINTIAVSPLLPVEMRAPLAALLGCGTVAAASQEAPPRAGSWLLTINTASEVNGVSFRIGKDNTAVAAASHSSYLYSFLTWLTANRGDEDISAFEKERLFQPAFLWQRSSYDNFLTQEWRIQAGLDRETYVREMARQGFTHLEVNGLAYPMGLENGPGGETYPMFYTYCPALDQFVSSSLNKGLYPAYYLSANLAYLRENAALARQYGLVPGLLCFEPRSVPERFFDRYPMLRGARVDHPFRSFKPRYNMTITHPRVREHYAEMVEALMREVPDLGFLSVWTNDSGAGFEHTKSLYVGRNGGAYLIREWRDDAEISRLAGENALTFLRTLRDAATTVNPDFKVITRMESFYGEHDTVWAGFEPGLEVETASLAARGWAMPYTHPSYPDISSFNGGTIYQQEFADAEKTNLADLRARGSEAHFYFSPGTRLLMEPLTGIPYPTLLHRRLRLLHREGVRHLALCGGGFPPEMVPWNINFDILSRFQWDPDMDIEETITDLAQRWGGREWRLLVRAWHLAEQAILAYPGTTGLYATIGFAWYRLWVRPFVPDMEAVDAADRERYERYMCTTPHNPNNVDLSRDVLFTLTTPEKSAADVERIDHALWKPLEEAISILTAEAKADTGSVFHDQWIRLRAMRCWFLTQRNAAAWIAGVYGYMKADSEDERRQHRTDLDAMIDSEIANSRTLIDLLQSGVSFMAVAGRGETPLIYGGNLEQLLHERIRIMQQHRNDEPRIDPDYIMRQAAKPV
ncbi:hypothetical protein JXO52_15590 [bacterium]|nr:hypothetical protein [bacterium]